MKNTAIILTLFLLFSCNNVNKNDNIHSIKMMLDDQVKAWNSGDIDGFMKGYHKDSSMQFISKKGCRKGWENTLVAYKKHYPNKDSMGKLIFDLDEIEFLDQSQELGHVTGKWRLIRTADTPSGYFSLITKKINSEYKIIIDHTW